MKESYADFSDLLGKTLVRIEIETLKYDGDVIKFFTSENEEYRMYHDQDCCESVELIDFDRSEIEILLDSPILMAEVETNEADTSWGSETWTFYKLATIKGYVTLRWYGESNGYYSESVSFYKITEYAPWEV
jgi:hypothetical protein